MPLLPSPCKQIASACTPSDACQIARGCSWGKVMPLLARRAYPPLVVPTDGPPDQSLSVVYASSKSPCIPELAKHGFMSPRALLKS
eukprot:1156870-Pelagomonas_calceolata.AAC.4